jgi:hypothetical protein
MVHQWIRTGLIRPIELSPRILSLTGPPARSRRCLHWDCGSAAMTESPSSSLQGKTQSGPLSDPPHPTDGRSTQLDGSIGVSGGRAPLSVRRSHMAKPAACSKESSA